MGARRSGLLPAHRLSRLGISQLPAIVALLTLSAVSLVVFDVVGISAGLVANAIYGVSIYLWVNWSRDRAIPKVLPSFDVGRFCESVSKARDHIIIMDIWCYSLFDKESEPAFKRALEEVIKNRNADIRIILTDPCSDAAKERARQLSQIPKLRGQDIQGMMAHQAKLLIEGIRHIALRHEISLDGDLNRIVLKFSKETPSIAFYDVDGAVRWNSYPSDDLALKGEIYAFHSIPGENWSRHFRNMFEKHWDTGEIFDLRNEANFVIPTN